MTPTKEGIPRASQVEEYHPSAWFQEAPNLPQSFVIRSTSIEVPQNEGGHHRVEPAVGQRNFPRVGANPGNPRGSSAGDPQHLFAEVEAGRPAALLGRQEGYISRPTPQIKDLFPRPKPGDQSSPPYAVQTQASPPVEGIVTGRQAGKQTFYFRVRSSEFQVKTSNQVPKLWF